MFLYTCLLGQTTAAGFSLLPQEIKGWAELAQNEGVVVEERDPVGQVEDDEDGRRDVEGANVDVVAQLGRRRSASLLERRQLHLVLLPLLLRRRRRRRHRRRLVRQTLLLLLVVDLLASDASGPPTDDKSLIQLNPRVLSTQVMSCLVFSLEMKLVQLMG